MARAGRQVAHVDVLVQRVRDFGDRQQPALVADLHRDRLGADAVEDLARQALRHHAARRGVEHERRRVRGGEAVGSQLRRKLAIDGT